MAAALPTDRVPDEELLAKVAAGDAQAFTSLFRRRQPDVFRFAAHMTGSAATADDVVQEVFLAVMRDANRYEPGRATVAAWLCGIARNCVRQRLERDRRLTPVDFSDGCEPEPEAGGPADPLAGLLYAERIDTLRRAVQTLPGLYREAVVLCDLQEMSVRRRGRRDRMPGGHGPLAAAPGARDAGRADSGVPEVACRSGCRCRGGGSGRGAWVRWGGRAGRRRDGGVGATHDMP